MTAEETIHVQIGQVKIGRPGQQLNAILGSCIGIGFLCPQRSIFGLAHCLLSESAKPIQGIGGRHVDQALVSLIKLMDITDKERRRLRVVLAGGANMTMPEGTDPSKLVGAINAKYAFKAIRDAGIRTIHEDLGGIQGRQVTINCTSGNFVIAPIPRLGALQ